MSMGSNPGVQVPLGLDTAPFIRGLTRAGAQGRQFAGQFIGFQARMQAAADRAAARIAEVQLRTSATVAAAQARGAASVANAQRRADAMIADSQRRLGSVAQAQRQSQIAHAQAVARANAAVVAAQAAGGAALAAAQQRQADARFRQMQAQLQQARSVKAAQDRVVYAQDRAAASVQAAQDRAAASVGAAQDRAQKAVANAHARAAQQAMDSRRAIEAQMAAIRAQMTRTWGERFGALIQGARDRVRAFVADLSRIAPMMSARFGMALGRDAAGAIGARGVLGQFSMTSMREQAMDMETQMSRLQRATGATDEKVRRLGMDLRGVAMLTPGAKLSDVFDIAISGAKLGIADDQIRLFTRDMAKVSTVLEDIPIDEATTRFSRILNVFSMGTDQAIRLASALNKLDLSSNANARDILDITNRIAPTARHMRMTLPQTMALATSLRESGVPIETAGTATSQIMGRMADRRFTGRFAHIAGMDPRSFRDLMQRDALGSIQAVERGLSHMSREGGIEALNRLSLDGQRVRGVMLSLATVMPQVARHTREATRDFATMDSIQGSFARAAGLTGSQLTLMDNSLKLLAVDLGRALLPVVRGFARGLVDLTTDIRGWANRNGAMFEAWGKTVGDVFENIGVAWREFPTIVEYGTTFALEKWEQFVEAMGRMWNAVWETIKYGGRVAGVFLGNLFTSINAAIQITIDDIMGKIGGVFGGAGIVDMGARVGALFGGGGGIQAAGAGIPKNLPMQNGPVFGKPIGRGNLGDLFSMDELTRGVGGVDRGPMAAAWRHLLDPLPNRAGELGEIGGRLADARQRRRQEREAARRAEDERDAAARRAAELGRHTAAEARRGFRGNPPARWMNQWKINFAIERRAKEEKKRKERLERIRAKRRRDLDAFRHGVDDRLLNPPDIDMPQLRSKGVHPDAVDEARRTNEKLDRLITLFASLDRKGFGATYG